MSISFGQMATALMNSGGNKRPEDDAKATPTGQLAPTSSASMEAALADLYGRKRAEKSANAKVSKYQTGGTLHQQWKQQQLEDFQETMDSAAHNWTDEEKAKFLAEQEKSLDRQWEANYGSQARTIIENARETGQAPTGADMEPFQKAHNEIAQAQMNRGKLSILNQDIADAGGLSNFLSKNGGVSGVMLKYGNVSPILKDMLVYEAAKIQAEATGKAAELNYAIQDKALKSQKREEDMLALQTEAKNLIINASEADYITQGLLSGNENVPGDAMTLYRSAIESFGTGEAPGDLDTFKETTAKMLGRAYAFGIKLEELKARAKKLGIPLNINELNNIYADELLKLEYPYQYEKWKSNQARKAQLHEVLISEASSEEQIEEAKEQLKAIEEFDATIGQEIENAKIGYRDLLDFMNDNDTIYDASIEPEMEHAMEMLSNSYIEHQAKLKEEASATGPNGLPLQLDEKLSKYYSNKDLERLNKLFAEFTEGGGVPSVEALTSYAENQSMWPWDYDLLIKHLRYVNSYPEYDIYLQRKGN